MTSLTAIFRRALPAVPLVLLGLAGSAQADRIRDRVQADAFGNLVVWSSSGYKRIVVGRGDLAAELDSYVGGSKRVQGHPKDSLYGEDNLRYDRRHRYHSGYYSHGDSYRGCYRPPVFVKGRAYMYGLADGEMPELAPCLPYND